MKHKIFHRPEVKLNEGLSIEDVKKIISLILQDKYPSLTGEAYKFCMEQRDWDIMISDGYNDPRFRTVCFVVTGSPNKLYGAITLTEFTPKHYEIITNFKKYYWTGARLTKRRPE